MQDKLAIGEFQKSFVAELHRLNYKKATLSEYRRISERLVEYAEREGVDRYSVDFGCQFLESEYPVAKDQVPTQWTLKQRRSRRALQLIDDFSVNGIITLRKQTGNDGLNDYDSPLLERYEQHLTNLGQAKRTGYSKAYIARRFLRFLDGKQQLLGEIAESDVIQYLKSESGCAQSTRSTIIYSLKRFLNYLYSEKLIATDLAPLLPQGHTNKLSNIVSVWEPGNLEKILGVIDRGSPIGRRDYAIILLATKLGLRTIDIFGLCKDQINWDDMRIDMTQSKTGQPISHSLPEDVGWAIIDYLKYGRPASDLPYVFVCHSTAVLGKQLSGSFQATVVKYVRQANIRLKGAQKTGLHSMRHTLACRLLDNYIRCVMILSHSNTLKV